MIQLIFGIGLICALITSTMYHMYDMYKKPVSRFQIFHSQQQEEESEEYRELFARFTAFNQIPIPVGTWETSGGNDHTHYLLKVNNQGGFVLSFNTYKDKGKMAVTGLFKVKGSTLIAEHTVGPGKSFFPRNGHLIIKSLSSKQMEIIEPKTLNIIKMKLT